METHAQYSIKHCLEMIAPFEASNQQLEEGQLQFYQFMVSIYRGMYEKPERFLVFPEPYEQYVIKLKQKEAHKSKEKEHTNDSKESTLRNTFQQAIPPAGWTKWVIPSYEYILVECENENTFSQVINYMNENSIALVGAVHDFTCPETGKNYIFFPIRAI